MSILETAPRLFVMLLAAPLALAIPSDINAYFPNVADSKSVESLVLLQTSAGVVSASPFVSTSAVAAPAVLENSDNDANGRASAISALWKKKGSSFLVGALPPPLDAAGPAPIRNAAVAASSAVRTVGVAENVVNEEPVVDALLNGADASGISAVSSMGLSLARKVPLTEEGYKAVAAEKNDEEMKAYVRRILAANGLGVNASNEGALNGFVPYYSGAKAVQSLQRLQEELQRVPWVVRIPAFVAESLMNGASGSNAPLTEAGYQLMTRMRSDKEMAIFMRRLLEEDHVRLRAGAEAQRVLEDLAPHYSGTVSEQSLAKLRRELIFSTADLADDESAAFSSAPE